jgi:hypothetical protein
MRVVGCGVRRRDCAGCIVLVEQGENESVD